MFLCFVSIRGQGMLRRTRTSVAIDERIKIARLFFLFIYCFVYSWFRMQKEENKLGSIHPVSIECRISYSPKYFYFHLPHGCFYRTDT